MLVFRIWLTGALRETDEDYIVARDAREGTDLPISGQSIPRLDHVWIALDDVTVQFENWLPAALRDVDEPYEDDIIARDAATATDAPLRIVARLPCGILL